MNTATMPPTTRPSAYPAPLFAEGSLLATAARLYSERCARALAAGPEILARYPVADDGHCTCPDAVRCRQIRRQMCEEGRGGTPLDCKHDIARSLGDRLAAGLVTYLPLPTGGVTIRPRRHCLPVRVAGPTPKDGEVGR